MRYTVRWLVTAIMALVCAVTGLAVSSGPASAQTVPVNVTLDDAATVNAALDVSNVSIVNGQAVLTGTLSGTVSIAGVSGTIPSQSFTLTASATCKSGTGTLTLTTSPITATLSNGTRATVSSSSVTISATCGKTSTLTVSTAPATANLSDGTTVKTSQCSISVSSPSSTSLGTQICDIQALICQLADDLAGESTAEVVGLLNQILSSTLSIA